MNLFFFFFSLSFQEHALSHVQLPPAGPLGLRHHLPHLLARRLRDPSDADRVAVQERTINRQMEKNAMTNLGRVGKSAVWRPWQNIVHERTSQRP